MEQLEAFLRFLQGAVVDLGLTHPAVLALVVVFGVLLVATRKRPGRRPHKPPPGRAEATRDSWWFAP